ncbi:bifunctional DedA family/phosphatase PAP2 family protein [Patescibacteria group bacterium]|nr:bifunctional DedA family/phosphatase PAP2 family protein [Patescibacteria group bacterium]MBU1663000.1 bifunctional DedA family/phosphatase PAP2 family protein [Patescibacteria group bacterium]MBU1934176.1 bifunctional DedA family/phosphatase PAP2 family protein [Patescibacteria group bacterium]MBU2007539.1 bifunctional DedA family/phosphatase PAP2 family protein [Patescibacteria group bacterium]MBU2264128.1 bifunctional DedA family/phosphatase PAP2 family protein [Patescibacteria group bact
MFNVNDLLLNLPLPLLDHWGYIIIFLAAIAETLPILGTLIPGQTIIILGGFLAKIEIFQLEAVMVVAAFGVVIGDLLAYYIGHKFGYTFVIRYGKYFFLNQEKYKKTKDLVSEHTGKALIVGRFSPFTRAVAAFLAGIYKINFSKFVFYSIVGGISWSTLSVLFGYIIGQGFEGAAKYFGHIVLAAIILIVLIFLAYRELNKRKQVFVKKHSLYLILNVVSIYIFSKMVKDCFDKESIYRLDLWLAQNIVSVWRLWLNKLMIITTNIFSPEILLAIVMLVAIYYFIKKNWYNVALIFTSSVGGLILGAILKQLVGRLRPAGGLVSESGLSFPSQHALIALIFFSLAMFLFTKKIKNKLLKYLFIFSNLFLIMLVGFSRIYLKVHWFSDVMAGFTLGLFWLTFLILIFAVVIKLFKDKKYGEQ